MPAKIQPPQKTSNKFSCCLLLLLIQDLQLASLSRQATSLSVCSGSTLVITTPTHLGFITQMTTIILAFAFAQSLIFRKLAGTQITIHLSKWLTLVKTIGLAGHLYEPHFLGTA